MRVDVSWTPLVLDVKRSVQALWDVIFEGGSQRAPFARDWGGVPKAEHSQDGCLSVRTHALQPVAHRAKKTVHFFALDVPRSPPSRHHVITGNETGSSRYFTATAGYSPGP